MYIYMYVYVRAAQQGPDLTGMMVGFAVRLAAV